MPTPKTRRRFRPREAFNTLGAPLQKDIVRIWALGAGIAGVVALAAAVLHSGESISLAGASSAVSIVSLLAASFLWLARSRVGSRSR